MLQGLQSGQWWYPGKVTPSSTNTECNPREVMERFIIGGAVRRQVVTKINVYQIDWNSSVAETLLPELPAQFHSVSKLLEIFALVLPIFKHNSFSRNSM